MPGSAPSKTHAARGRLARRLEPEAATAPVVRWTFAQRLAGDSFARVTRAPDDAAIGCVSAADLIGIAAAALLTGAALLRRRNITT